MKITYSSIGQIGQWLSLLLTSVGLYFMLTHKTPIGDDYATTGALVLTIATKIRYYGSRLFSALSRAWTKSRLGIPRDRVFKKSFRIGLHKYIIYQRGK